MPGGESMSDNMSPEQERRAVLLGRWAAACAVLALLLLAWFLYDVRAAGDTNAGVVLLRSLFSLRCRAAVIFGLQALVLGVLAVSTTRSPTTNRGIRRGQSDHADYQSRAL